LVESVKPELLRKEPVLAHRESSSGQNRQCPTDPEEKEDLAFPHLKATIP